MRYSKLISIEISKMYQLLSFMRSQWFSNSMLSNIDQILQEWNGTQMSFSGISIIAVGDLCQLKPVGGDLEKCCSISQQPVEISFLYVRNNTSNETRDYPFLLNYSIDLLWRIYCLMRIKMIWKCEVEQHSSITWLMPTHVCRKYFI